MKDDLGNRMKRFEEVAQTHILPRMPAIIRIDGRAFHTFTKKSRWQKPFDSDLHNIFVESTQAIMDDIGGTARLGYTQSDEVSILLYDCNRYDSIHWFGRNIQKICSIAASCFTAHFNSLLDESHGLAMFDARVFSIPQEDVPNYFLWRFKDAQRNSIQAFAQSRASHEELQGKSCQDLLTQFPEWHRLPEWCREGQFINYSRELEHSPYILETQALNRWFKNEVFFREEG